MKEHVIFGNIGIAGFHQPFGECLHLVDMLSRARLDGRRQAAESRHILLEILVSLVSNFADRNPALGGARIDLVVDVGDVADIGDMFLAVDMTQQAKQHVEYDDGARIADMGKVVDGRSAHIHAYASGIDRRECPLLACQRIVEPEFHSK